MLQDITSAVQKAIFCPHTGTLDNACTKQNGPNPHANAPAEGHIDAGRFHRLIAHACRTETNTHSNAVFVWVLVAVALLYLVCPLPGLGVFPGLNRLQDTGSCINKSSVSIKGSLVTPYTHMQIQTYSSTAQRCY